MTTTIGYNVTTAAGRAITHLLENTCLRHSVGNGLEVRGGGNGRILEVSDRYEDLLGDGEGSLLILIESLAGYRARLDLNHLFGSVDSDHAVTVAQAVWMAGGFGLIQLATDDDRAAAEVHG
jgi:hypothetical protein